MCDRTVCAAMSLSHSTDYKHSIGSINTAIVLAAGVVQLQPKQSTPEGLCSLTAGLLEASSVVGKCQKGLQKLCNTQRVSVGIGFKHQCR